MNFRKAAAQFFQNIADYLDPVSAWENERCRESIAMQQRHAQGNFLGREWTPEEAYQHNVEYFRKGLENMQSEFAKIREAQKAGLI